MLTIDEIDPDGKIPEFKFCAVKVEPAGAAGTADDGAARRRGSRNARRGRRRLRRRPHRGARPADPRRMPHRVISQRPPGAEAAPAASPAPR